MPARALAPQVAARFEGCGLCVTLEPSHADHEESPAVQRPGTKEMVSTILASLRRLDETGTGEVA